MLWASAKPQLHCQWPPLSQVKPRLNRFGHVFFGAKFAVQVAVAGLPGKLAEAAPTSEDDRDSQSQNESR